MKIKAIIYAALLAVSFSTYANPGCEPVRDIAKIVMQYRQEGLSYSQMQTAALKNDNMRGSNGMEQAIVRLSFTYPRIYDYEARGMLIAQFGNEVFDICSKNSK